MTASPSQILAGLNAAMGPLREEVQRSRSVGFIGFGLGVVEGQLGTITDVPYDLRGAACIDSGAVRDETLPISTSYGSTDHHHG